MLSTFETGLWILFIPLANFVMLVFILFFAFLILFLDLWSLIIFMHHEFIKVVFIEGVNKRKMSEVEKWVYLRHRTIFGATFIQWCIKKEIKKAVKKGNVVECNEVIEEDIPNCMLEGKIIYASDEFEDIIILEATGNAKKLSLEEQKECVRPKAWI